MNSPRFPADHTPATAHGGTFVRPGAFAWGRPAPSDPAGDGADSAVVEDALAVAVKDPDRITDLLDELRRGRLWLPLPDGDGPVTDGSAVHLPTVTYLGAEFVPAFTSVDRLTAWSQGGPVPLQAAQDRASVVPHIVVPAAELAMRLPPDMGIALNPGAQASVPIYPDGIGYLAGAVTGEAAGAVTGEVLVGHPPAEPVAFLGEVRARLCTVPAVQQASRAWLSVPGLGEGLVISVTLHDPADETAHHEVISAVEEAAEAAPHQFPIDVTFPGEGEPDQVDKWIASFAQPFYVRT
jgi:SseB protein N-terminal domain/SseB protein C-terminal domain